MSSFCEIYRPSIFCVSEHWLHQEESQFYGSIHTLQMASAYYRSTYKCGGTAIFVKKELNFKVLDFSDLCSDMDVEISAIELVDLNICVLSLYRSPQGDLGIFFAKLDICLARLIRLNKNIILGGDVNISLNDIHLCNSRAAELANLVRSYGLFIANFQPTREGRCLDTVATDLDSSSYKVEVVDPLIADHDAVVMTLHRDLVSSLSNVSHPLNNDLVNYRVITEEGIALFKAALGNLNWDAVLQAENPETGFKALSGKLMQVFDRYFPVKTKKRSQSRKNYNKNHHSTWFTPDLQRIKNYVLFLRDIFRSCKNVNVSNQLRDLYLHWKKVYKRKVDAAKKISNANFIKSSSNQCQAAWQLVNSSRNHTSGAGGSTLKCTASPDEFNDYLLDTVDSIVNSMPPSLGISRAAEGVPLAPSRMRSWKQVSPLELVKIVKAYKNSNSSDVNGMSISLLKCIIEEIAHPLAVAINRCLFSGQFPDCLKVSRTIPVFKKGDPNWVGSYRPISIIPVLGKVMESVMNSQLVSYLESNMLLSNLQHGFRKGHSTVTAVADLLEKVIGGFENNEITCLTLCDLSKAFDCISHCTLVDKLERYGLVGPVLNMFRSYLTGRLQILSVNGQQSTPREVRHGVPQGSILGPVLFLVAVNDLRLDGNVLLFADDTTIFTSGRVLNQVAREADALLERARLWFTENRLKLNEDKTQLLLCSLKHYEDLPQQSVKLLGFALDARFSWNDHISMISLRLTRVIFLLLKLTKLLPDSFLTMVYYSLFHSHLSYGLMLWGHASGGSVILKLQKRAVRIITSSEMLDHCRPLFIRLGILTFYSQYILDCLINIRANLGKFEVRSKFHNYETRNRTLLDVPYCRLSKSRDCYPVIAQRMFNKLPTAVRALELKKFSVRMREWLRRRPYYSVREFFEDDRVSTISA